MAEKIKLVQGDNLPYIRLTLTDPATGAIINLSDAGVLVRVYFRAANTTTVLHTIQCEKVDGQIQTVYEVLKFNVRPQFA